MNRTTVKSTARLVTSLALRHVAQRHGGAHRGWSALAAAFFTATAIAGNNVFQQGAADGDGDYLASNSANWGQPGQVSTDGATGETTITEMSFSNPYVTTFDKMINTGTYIWVGTTGTAFDGTDAFAVWRAKDGSADYGISQTAGDMPIADASNQKGKLKIESGTYRITSNLKVGANGGTAQLEMTGGALAATGDFRIASNGNDSTGTVKISGGTVTAGGMVALATESGGAAEMTIANATVAATGIAYIGRSGGTATLTVDNGGTFSTQGDISIGSNGGDSHGKLIVDGGDVLGKYWLTTGRDKTTNTAEIEVKSGNLKIGQFDNTNAMIDLSDTSGTTTTFKQSGGYVYAPGSGNSGDKGVALALSNSDGGEATYEMTGGTLALGGVIDVGRYGTGTFKMSGGTVTASKYMRLGYGANSTATVHISGGELTAGGSTDNKNYYGLMLADSASSTATFTIDGGTATFTEDSNVGWNGSGTLNIGGTGKLSVGTASVHKWLRMNTQSAATGKSVINLSGNGVFDICHVRLEHGTGEINFDGGTIHAYANNSSCGGVVIAASDNLTVNVKDGGATFDVPSGVAVSIAEPLLEDSNSTGGGLTKTGTGTLTLADGNTYTGGTTVNEGMLVLGTGTYGAATVAGGAVLTVPAASAPSAITIAERGLVLVDVSSLELTTDAETAINLANITLPEGAKDPALYVAPKGKRAVFTFTQSGGTWTLASARLAAEGESAVDVFLGSGAGTGVWRTNRQWSLGVAPTAADTAVLPFSGTVDMVGNVTQTASNVVINTPYVKFNSTDGWPSFGAEEITGIEGATLALQTVGLKPASGKTMKVYVDCDCVATNPDQDTWFDGNDADSRLEMHGNICATNSPFRLNGNTDIYGKLIANRPLGDDNYISGGVTFQPGSELIIGENGEVKITGSNTFQGNVTVNGVLQNRSNGTTFSAGTVLSGSGTLDFSYTANIAANIEGALTINLIGFGKNGAGYTHLSGDNSLFTGTLHSQDYHICTLDSTTSGSAAAVWDIHTDLQFRGATAGTLKFGTLNLVKHDWSCFYVAKNLNGLEIEVGHRNEDMTWSDGYFFGTYNTENSATSTGEFTDAVIRKTGTGTLYTYANQYTTIEMNGGTVALKDSHGPGTAFVWTGGTLRFDAAYNWDPTGRFDFTKSTAAIDIDTAGNSFIWGTAFAGANDLVKRGEGTLHLTGAHTYTGATKVLGGELILPYRDLGSAAIEVAEGAELALDMSGATIAEGTPTSFGVAADDGTKDRIVFSGADWTFTLARDAATGALSYTAASNDDTVPNRWIGGAAGSWSLAGNWSRGIPTDKQTVRFDSDAAVTLDGSKTVSNIVNNAYVQFRTTNTGVHPTLYIREVNGTGTNALWHAGFIANGLPGTIAAEATVEILNCGNSDSWLEGDYAASPLKIYGNICGNGYLICRDYVYFYGDTSGHTANVLMEQAGQKHFCSTTSGFPSSARLEIQGTATVDCMDGVTFGALNIAEWNGYLGFDVPEGFEGTIKVGANNKDATIGNTMSFFEIRNAGGWNTGCAAATLEKIGSGTLRCGIQNACKIQVTEGTVEFTAANTAADITVAAGATLSGTTDQTVKSVKFEDGAYYRLTRTSEADNVYTVNSLTATTIEFGKNVYLYLNEADRVKAAAGTVLSGNVTGSPMATVLNEAKTGIAACNGEGWYWTASKTDSGVNLVAAQVAETSVNALATDEATVETQVSIRDADLAAWLEANNADESVNTANDNGVTGIMAYMLGAETYEDAAKPTMGATVADGVATLTFDDSAFRRVPGLKLAYYLESCDAADFSGEVVRSEESDDPAVQLEFANAKIFNRLRADVRASE